jgi:membrane-bound lytic murein transglycosylase B
MTTIAQQAMLARAVMRAITLATFLAASAAPAAPATVPQSYAGRPDVSAFIDEVVADYGFDARALRRFFAKVRYQRSVINAMSRPVLEPPKWYQYAPQFLSASRIDGGVAFWRANAATLERAQNEFGVPAEIVVAIIGVETFYGRNAGSYRVADALTTLAFDYPRRAEYFRNELKQFLLQTREQKISPFAPKGSYAGAQGLPQFMSSSLRDYAVDYDNDGKIDLAADIDDAVGSVANYLAWHGWQTGESVMKPASIDVDKRDEVERMLDGGISDRRALESWQRDGVNVTGTRESASGTRESASGTRESASGIPESPPGIGEAPSIPESSGADSVGVLMLEEEGEPSYWVVFNNWYVLTRYNRSRLYASAVWRLAQELKRALTE